MYGRSDIPARRAACLRQATHPLIEAMEQRLLFSGQVGISATAGSLDPTFGTAGIVRTDAGDAYDDIMAMVQQADGKLLVAGRGAGNRCVVMRYLPDGQVDSSFGNGKVSISYSVGHTASLALQPDGKILVATGYYNSSTGLGGYAVARLNPSGTYDSTFAGTGQVVIPFGQDDRATAVMLQQDGRVVVGGHAVVGGSRILGMARLHADGTFDDTFGSGGKAIQRIGTADTMLTDLELAPDGKFIAAGYYGNGLNTGQRQYALARYNPDGSPDLSFGSGGAAILPDDGVFGGKEISKIALTGDGKIIAAGTNTGSAVVLRFTADGALDWTFGAGGIVATNLSPTNDVYGDVLVDASGRYLAVGGAKTTGYPMLAVARYLEDGQLDGTFGTGGLAITDLPTEGEMFSAAMLTSDGKLVAGGYQGSPNVNWDFALARYLTSDTPTVAAQITGRVWDDLDRDQALDVYEPGLGGWVVYLDQNLNMLRDPDEAFTLTDPDGSYRFTDLAPGRYHVGQELPLGWEQTTPGAAGAVLSAGTATVPLAQRTTALSYTGSTIPVTLAGGRVQGAVAPSDAESASLVGLDRLRADPRFADVDGRGYAVAILDTGIDLDHRFFGPDLDNNGIADRIIYQYDFADHDGNASDYQGHGSHVSGIAAGSDPVYGGMAPGANIIALKVFTDGNYGDFSYIEQALQWVVANAAAYHIAAINLSLGDEQNWAMAQQLYGISDELAALAEQQVIVVSAAGNSYYSNQSQGVAYPAADPNSLAVGAVYDAYLGWRSYADGATDYNTAPDRIASFSQRSSVLTDIFAPGAVITGADHNGYLADYSGTSQAAPHITGIAVLAQQLAMQYLGRRLSMGEFASLLNTTGVTIVDGDDEEDNVSNSYASYRRVDVYAMAQAIYNMGATRAYGYTVDLDYGQIVTANFGDVMQDLTPAMPDLSWQTDTGRSNFDDLTRYNNGASATRLQFTVGGTLAGSTVRIYANGLLVGSAGGWDSSTTLWTDGLTRLPDGLVTFTARQLLPGRAESADSQPLLVRIDTSAPQAPAAPDLQAGSDTGVSQSDDLTRDNTPTLDLLASEAGYLSLYSGTTLLNRGYVAGAGPSPLTLGGSATFTPYVQAGTGTGAYDSDTGDVNGDGKLDLITANSIGKSLTVSLSRGNGTFYPAIVTPFAGGLVGVAVADFNGDGKLDALISSNTAQVFVLFGTGTGTFTTGPTLTCTAGNYILNVRAADVNGDGKADAIAAERTTGSLRVFLGNGSGEFDLGRSFATGGDGPSRPQVADVNLDGRADLLVVSYAANQITVLLGNGDGTFASPLSTAVGNGPVGFAIADFDRDGIPDVTVTEHAAHRVEFLKGRGDGTFTRSGQFPIDYNNVGGIAADFDLDGNIDYVTTTQSAGAYHINLLQGNGDGTFRPYKAFAVAGTPSDLDKADFNGDGRMDVAVTTYDVDGASVLLAAGGGLSEGQYALSCTLEDAAGNISALGLALTLVVDMSPATISQVRINSGQLQRSMVRQLEVLFSEPVALSTSALQVKLQNGTLPPNTALAVTNPSGDQKTYTLTFSGSAVIGGSLPDGIYDLIVSAAGVQDLAGNTLTANYTQRFHRLFGDSDGNRIINALDYARLKQTFGRAPTDPLFNSAFDYEGNGLINALDLARFRQRYGMSFSY